MANEVPDVNILRRQVDRRQLQEIIAGLAEGILLIDPAGGIVWANERALDLHDAEELAALGRTPAEYRQTYLLKYRNNHALAPEQYPLDRLLAGEVFEDVVVEVVKAAPPKGKEGWRSIHQLRGLALADSAGDPESYVLVIQDLTERFTAEERFERTFAANPAPAIICRLADLRYVKVNHGFLEMTGYKREEVLGRSTYEIDVLENAAGRDSAIAALREGRTIPQTEATLRMADGEPKLVIVAGQPIEVGEEPCMLFTFMDMEPRRRAELALRQSEERFSRAFRMTPVPTIVMARKDFRVLDVNEAFAVVLGYAPDEVIDKPIALVPIWSSSASWRQLERDIESDGTLRNREFKLRSRHGESLDCLVSAETVGIQGQDCVLIVLQDITERKRSEVELMSAIEAVMQDTSWFSRTVIEKLANLRDGGASNGASTELADLTPRELEVLGLLCQGLSDAQIVKALKLTRNTVRNHVARIYGKAGVHSRAAAVVWARERGFTGASQRAAPRRSS
ncbi:PAS domain S-box protein [Labrys sp. 22185]|uniref:helix-turn-helix transcriptional regulator n=1 Tax=Labrys sp. 22185 TaxID=3453888 RepID=UPI003F868F57